MQQAHPQSSVYATPVRVTNRRDDYEAEIPYPDYAGAPAPPRSATGFRSLKSKSHSRNSHYPNFTMVSPKLRPLFCFSFVFLILLF